MPPVQWMLHSTDSSAVPLPGLTKRLSEGERKAFPAPCLPSLHGNVGAGSGSSLLEGWENGGFVKGMPGTKGCIYRQVCVGEQHAECVALRTKLLQWVHKDMHGYSVETASQNNFVPLLEVCHMRFVKSLYDLPQTLSQTGLLLFKSGLFYLKQ